MTIDNELIGQIFWGIIGIIVALGTIGLIGSFWSLGRSGYRED